MKFVTAVVDIDLSQFGLIQCYLVISIIIMCTITIIQLFRHDGGGRTMKSKMPVDCHQRIGHDEGIISKWSFRNKSLILFEQKLLFNISQLI